jgi:hypothetical protein
MKKSQLQQIIKEEITKALQEAPPAEKEKVQGSADFKDVAKSLNVDSQELLTIVNKIKQGEDITVNKKYLLTLATLVINMIKTNNDTAVQNFANQVKKLEVK